MGLKLQDLRIGNYLIYEATTHVVISIGNENGGGLIRTWWVNHKTNLPVIEYNQGDESLNPYYDFLEHHEGIPITIKELKRFNMDFDYNGNAGKFGGNWDYIFYPAGNIKVKFFEGEMTVVFQGGGITSIAEIKYIHELQNLAYFLYKKELIFEEILVKTH